MCALLGGGLQNKGKVAGVILLYASYISCSNSKKWLKSVYIYRGYCKMLGLFLNTLYATSNYHSFAELNDLLCTVIFTSAKGTGFCFRSSLCVCVRNISES